MSEHAKEQKRFGDNRERLKAERLAREATVLTNSDTAPIRTKKPAAKKRSASTGEKVKT
jgi:hypothetical protein